MKRFTLLVVLTMLGFLGNYFNLPILPGVNFVFGSIFILLIFQIYGFWGALLSSLLASAYTVILWGHPFGVFMFALEIIFVELWTREQKEWGLITAGVLYWLMVAPIVISVLLWGMAHYEFQSTVLIALKLSVNGMVNFVTAVLLFQCTPLKTLSVEGRSKFTSSSAAVLFAVVVAVVVFPVLATTFSHGHALLHGNQSISESLVEHYITDWMRTFGFLGISIIVIWLVIRYFAAPLLELSTITTKLANSQGVVESITWPRSAVKEVRQLTSNVHVLVSRWNQHIRDLEQAKASYEYLSKHDTLTTLPNRAYFEELLEESIARWQDHEDPLWIYFLDIDSLKRVNDSLGHGTGDAILVEVAERLRNTVGESGRLARYGGDEFVLFASFPSVKEAEHLAEQICGAMKKPFRVVNFELSLSSSIGICTYPTDGGDMDKLIQSADLAMYEAKKAGKDRIAVYDKEMARQAARRLYLENALPKALEKGEIKVYYQPQVDVQSGTICGVEALARWQHPYLGMISPLEFIKYAEDSGFIAELGEWILTQACLDAGKWGRRGFDDITLSVNVSLRQMNQPNFVERVKDILHTVGFAPSKLELEITESVIMDNPELTRSVCRGLEEIGVRFAIDDFGTGYSSLESLHRLSLHTLKLDKGFVQNIGNERDEVVIKAIIDLAHNLGLNVVVEGVERVEQMKMLEHHGCSVMQGYLFAKPMSSHALQEFLRRIEELGVRYLA